MYVLPLSLQILVENAIKHNEVSREYPLTIRIYIDDKIEYLVVNNRIRRILPDTPSTGIGLNNLIQRYSLIGSRSPEIVQTDNMFAVYLPLISDE